MTKRNNIIYWIATLWASLGLTATAIVQVFGKNAEAAHIANLHYPGYFITLLGCWKFLGVIALLIPKFPLVKEWAYAGIFFVMTGALYSHLAVGDPFKEIYPCLLLLVLILISYLFRPAGKRLFPLMQKNHSYEPQSGRILQ
ncbi:MAG TPA: DoxX family protein [Puia sp.]|nr:DoxX family protein [Puia sp.]